MDSIIVEFVKPIVSAAQVAGSSVQMIPMRNKDLDNGCLIRFRIGGAY